MNETDPLYLPPCPITGRPARRAVHGVSARTVETLWKIMQGVDVDRLFAGMERVKLFESDTGLMFYHPPIVGDGRFYRDYYTRWNVHALLNRTAETRVDYRTAATFVPDGAEVIDIGCGPGVFARHLGHARYTGLDPFAEAAEGVEIIRESLEDHAEANPGRYDVATAFHVIEHVVDPLAHAQRMARLLRPGGLLILAAPLHPSPLTEIPNFLLNVPPHHVTWWNPGAYRALADEIGLEVVEAGSLPVSPHQGLVLWLHRFLLSRTLPPPAERYVSNRWSWHLALALAYPLAKLMTRIKALPSNARPVDAFLVARKPVD